MRPGRRFTHKARFSRVLDRNQGLLGGLNRVSGGYKLVSE